jgi:hypothetical protein
MTESVKTQEFKQKPGYKTSEFYLIAIAQLLGLLMASGVIETGTQWDKMIGVATTLLAGLGYTYSRTQIKSQ